MKKFITFLSIVTALMCNVTYGVKAESVNVIKNGDFSSYEKGSTSYQKNDKYTDYGIWYSSASAELFETPSGSANGCAGKVRATRLGQKIKLESGITYTLSFTYRSYSEGSANDADFGLFKYDTAEKVDYNNDENLIKDTLKTSSATFANYTKTFTCQETGDYALMFWNFTGGSGGTDTVYVDDVAITYETVPVITYEKLTSVKGIQISHHRRPKMSAMDAYSLSLVKLGSGNNLPGYYMYHGGTNAIGKHSSLNEWDCPVLSYDFQAPIGEFGIVRRHCGLLNMLHLFIQDFGDRLAVTDTILGDDVDLFDTRTLRYCMRSDENSGFVFVNHYQRLTELADVCDVQFRISDEFLFPDNSFDVKGDISFFMPFNMDLSGINLTYATAQPLCRNENTFFFVQIPGIDAEYKINDALHNEQDFEIDNIRIITLTYNRAQKLRRLNGKIYIGCNCDIYSMDDKIVCAQNGSFEYDEWDGNRFIRRRENIPFTEPEIIVEDTDEPDIDNCNLGELNFGCERKIVWKKLTVTGDEGYVVVPYYGDVAQIYVDGMLTADEFWYNKPWKVPAKLLAGKEVYLCYSEMKNDFYYEN